MTLCIMRNLPRRGWFRQLRDGVLPRCSVQIPAERQAVVRSRALRAIAELEAEAGGYGLGAVWDAGVAGGVGAVGVVAVVHW